MVRFFLLKYHENDCNYLVIIVNFLRVFNDLFNMEFASFVSEAENILSYDWEGIPSAESIMAADKLSKGTNSIVNSHVH